MVNANTLIIVEGEEYYLRKRKLEEVVNSLLKDGFSDFNYLKLDGKKCSLKDILSEWETLPFGSPKRVVHVEDFNRVKIASKDKKTVELFLDNLKNQRVKKSFLILECDVFDKRNSFNSKISKFAKVYSFKRVREWEFPEKIVFYTGEKGYSIDRDAVDLLAASFSDLMSLYSEIDKIIAFKGDDRSITFEDVQKLVFPAKNYTFFDLLDALIERDLKKSLKIGNGLLEGGTSMAAVFGYLESTFKKGFNIAFSGGGGNNLSFYQKKLFRLSSIYGREGVERALITLYKVLTLSRKGILNERFYLNYLLCVLHKIANKNR